jgi:hypothetical protein
MAQSALFNNGRQVGLLRGAGTRMASWFYAMHRALRLRPALVATVHQAQFSTIALVKTDERVRAAVNDIMDDDFWKSVYILNRAVYPLIRALRYCDANEPAMDKIFYLSHQATVALEKSIDLLNDKDLFPDYYDDGSDIAFELEQIFEGKPVADSTSNR